MHVEVFPLVGREGVCGALREILQAEPPRSVVLAGPPGVGRTRLAREALAAAERAGRSTRWVAATQSAAEVPLGALAHLLPPLDGAVDRLVLLDRAFHAIADDAESRRPVLAVDDVHLLDQLSMTLLHRLGASGIVSLVLTVRSGADVEDPAAPLWKDGVATRIDLQGLTHADTTRLVSEVVGGPVDSRTDERLWRLTQGNPLFLHEVLTEGQRAQQIRAVSGIWCWDGPIVPSPRLCALVRTQLGQLDAEEWRVLETLSMTGPLTSEELARFGSPRAVASLERRGLLRPHSTAGAAGELRTAHPVHAAVVRTGVSESTLRLVREQLLDGDSWSRDPGHLLRLALSSEDWDFARADPVALTEAARRALVARELAAAERLAGAAREAGAGSDATPPLVEALRWQGEPGRSEQLAAAAFAEARADGKRATLALGRLLSVLATPGREPEAREVLTAAWRTVRGSEARALLMAADGVLSLRGGQLDRALARANAAIERAPAGSTGHVLGTAVRAEACAWRGRTSDALAAVAASRAALDPAVWGPERIFVEFCLLNAEIVALHLSGRLEQLADRAAAFRQGVLAGAEWTGDALAAHHCGYAALAAGRVPEAVRWLTEAEVLLRHRDPAGLRPRTGSLLALARSLAGDVAGAQAVLDDPAGQLPGGPLVEPLRVLARACLSRARGNTGEAHSLAVRAAALARGSGQDGLTALVLYRSGRLDTPAAVAGPLRELADRLDAPLVSGWAAAAGAAAAGAPDELERVSAHFERQGALLHAAEAATAAAALRDKEGSRRAAAEGRTRALRLMQRCGMTGGQDEEVSLPTLTLREEEVALLAVRGLSNQAIADRLTLSVRTVEAHLSHVYTKFGITSRSELTTALEAVVARRLHRRGGPAFHGRERSASG